MQNFRIELSFYPWKALVHRWNVERLNSEFEKIKWKTKKKISPLFTAVLVKPRACWSSLVNSNWIFFSGHTWLAKISCFRETIQRKHKGWIKIFACRCNKNIQFVCSNQVILKNVFVLKLNSKSRVYF